MGNTNKNLHNAKRAKNDEFYTLYKDIEKEMRHYDFSGLTVCCPCNDGERSNFYKYFSDNFETLGLKRLICVAYNREGGSSYYFDNGERKELQGDGDFRSEEVIDLIKQADVVVTNPPFSLWREFFDLLQDLHKKFCILGNINSITYKNVFPYIKENKLWLGYELRNTSCNFEVPDEEE